jgi:hypothetical protein
MMSQMESYPDEVLACSDSKSDWDDLWTSDQMLMMFLDDENMSDGEKTTIIEDPNERYKAAKKYVEEHDAQVYTEVDGDDGEIYYSKGFRFVNRINQGLYTVVKVEGLEIDNS